MESSDFTEQSEGWPHRQQPGALPCNFRWWAEDRATSLLFQESLGLSPSCPTVFSFSFQTTQFTAVFSAAFSSRWRSGSDEMSKSPKKLPPVSKFKSGTRSIAKPGIVFSKIHFCQIQPDWLTMNYFLNCRHEQQLDLSTLWPPSSSSSFGPSLSSIRTG